jgi:hypothetical protein
MGKRRFRAARSTAADYPTLDAFDAGRRRFLAGLGGLLGAGALAACGSRAVRATDGGGSAEGSPPSKPDQGPRWPVDGDVDQPDARVDTSPWVPGEAPQPDAQLDSMGMSGGAPQPPAQLDAGCDDDSGSCPNP